MMTMTYEEVLEQTNLILRGSDHVTFSLVKAMGVTANKTALKTCLQDLSRSKRSHSST